MALVESCRSITTCLDSVLVARYCGTFPNYNGRNFMTKRSAKNLNVPGKPNPSAFLALSWAVVLISVMQALPAQAQLTELYAFQYNPAATSNYPDGAIPMAELIQGADGNYYTTTNIGGAGVCGKTEDQIPGCGAVVKITPEGVLSVFYSFPYDTSTSTAPDGWFPQAGLVQGKDGNFYGVASEGGTGGEACADTTGLSGCGTVFKLTPSGTLTVLHSFCGGSGCGSLTTDGAEPTGRMVFAANGDLYGTTQIGGLYNGFYNQGTIFRITTSGAYKVLHVFSGNFGSKPDGANPAAGLTLASNGDFYGTTTAGGASGDGTVFEMTASGKVTLLHSFTGSSDGSMPIGALVQASDGNLYGTCYSGGANGTGTVFRITTKGILTKIYDFAAEAAPGNIGYFPRAGLIQASDGNLYGTAWQGGPFATGTIYQLTLGGVGTLDASFDASTTGFAPLDALLQGSDGRLYVTLEDNGGENPDGVEDQGAISVLDLDLSPPAPGPFEFTPAKGLVGAKITLMGSAFVGTTAVKFNGTSAAYVVDASGYITATVPAGASSGTISMTNAGGITTSKNSFTVLP
jgi:uncharacterized repeat protein (TIGR03803 family)